MYFQVLNFKFQKYTNYLYLFPNFNNSSMKSWKGQCCGCCSSFSIAIWLRIHQFSFTIPFLLTFSHFSTYSTNVFNFLNGFLNSIVICFSIGVISFQFYNVFGCMIPRPYIIHIFNIYKAHNRPHNISIPNSYKKFSLQILMIPFTGIIFTKYILWSLLKYFIF